MDLNSDFGSVLSPLADSETADMISSGNSWSSALYNSDSRMFDGEGYRPKTGTPSMMKLSNSVWSSTVPGGQGGALWGPYPEVVGHVSKEVKTVEISEA